MIFLLRIELTYFLVVLSFIVDNGGVEFNAACTLFDIDKDYFMESVEAKVNSILS
jgi:hypothetical protein